ncbi:MAG TPA: aspartate aminotransferase family protein [Methylomirabilota bacterium]|jgi:glutamate-1-semialdehyde 2,1-aminomutase|nr:aspartate aminotransferase family protein [Methylomirabilota bacterium]
MADTVSERYRKTRPGSWAQWERACRVIPGGITHDSRHLAPFPLYVTQAAGPRKWDVDGHEYIDYWMGHGALFLGHAHPTLVEAVREQVARGTHYGACHELEVQWAEWITRLVPSAELVRFTMSGTEATHLAIRLARAATGRPKIVKFTGHFHGWHDGVSAGVNPPFEIPMSAGIPGAVLGEVLLSSPNDITALERLVASRRDVGAVILEPSGAQAGTVPIDPGFLKDLRQLTTDRGIVLIFDEVITGFRYAPGGAQEYYGVTPDLTTLAKIVAGGLPGAAVCGKRELVGLMTFGPDAQWNRTQRVAQNGTYNSNPLAAAAGIAMLSQIADGKLHETTNARGAQLRAALNDVFRKASVPSVAYGDVSICHISLEGPPKEGKPKNPALYHKWRCALILHGVDMSAYHGWVSTVHGDREIEETAQAVAAAVADLQADGAL